MSIPGNQTVTKRQPERTCVACRKIRAKRELVRVVCNDAGEIEIDTTGKKTGRGAYLCNSLQCWTTGLNKKKLEHALRCYIKEIDRDRLYSEVRDSFPAETGR